MIPHLLKIAIRTFSRNKGYLLINMIGLVTGIAFSCMLYIYVQHELSYDRFHTKSERIFRVLTIDKRDPQDVRRYGITTPALGPAVVSKFPEAVDMVRLHRFVGQVVFELNGHNFQERNWFTTDANFFSVFDFEFIEGDKTTALKEPHSVVLTESAAKRYFGRMPAVGEMIEKTSFGAVTVTGVIKDLPDNSHLQFDLLFSEVVPSDRWQKYLESWDEFGAFTYLVLRDADDINSLRSKMPAFRDQELARFNGVIDIDFQPMEDIYLHSEGIEAGTESSHGQLSYIYIFSSMGIFLLLIACMNYINLATSKAMVRSREVGVRKVAGARRGQLVAQFLTESLLITFASSIIAIFVMDLAFPYFNTITGKPFDITPRTLMDFLPALAGISLVIGIVSGSYPAFYLARLKPVRSLRGIDTGTSTAGLRKALVVFQFVITIVMIVSTLEIGRQLNFIHTKDLGFDKDRLMVIDINSGDVRQQFRAIKNEYARIPGVEHVAVSSRVPGEWKNITELYCNSPSSSAGIPDSTKTYFMGFDEDMLATYKLKLNQGRYFAPELNDSTNVLLNEAAVQALGLSEPVGATLRLSSGNDAVDATVIGVLEDFNFQSLHQKIGPIVIGAWNNPFQSIDYFNLKISGNLEALIPAITHVHEQFDQRTPIEYHFLDAQLESFYAAANRAGMIFRMGGALSILVACLGLFGLATYNIQRRTKELGIRKVLGASGVNLFMLLSSTVAQQVALALVIASPIAWYTMHQWLQAFEYRISLQAWIFLLAGAAALLVALLTISYRTIKAIRTNPVNSLRQE